MACMHVADCHCWQAGVPICPMLALCMQCSGKCGAHAAAACHCWQAGMGLESLSLMHDAVGNK